MNAAVAVELPLSTPCLQKRHSRCQLGDAMCSCACHTPEGLQVERPKIEKCDTLREACTVWMQAIVGSYVLRDEVKALCEYMRAHSPKKWQSWLDEKAEALVGILIAQESKPNMVLSGRGSMSPASVFASAVEDFEAGDKRSLDFLSVPYVIDENQTRNVLAELTHDDLKLPIDMYDRRAKAHAMEAAYLRAVQKKLPKDNSKTVGDVFTNEQLQTLREAATQTK